MKKQKILFIYNADSGFGNMLLDYGKKYISPETYECNLCMVTYGAFGMKREWKAFVQQLPYDVVFLHRDELRSAYPFIKVSYPAAVIVNEKTNTYETLINAKEFDTISSLSMLQEKILKTLNI